MRGPPPEGPGASQRWTGGLLERLSTASTFLGCPSGRRETLRPPLGAAEVVMAMAPRMTEARRRTLTLVLCCLAQFMVVLDVSIVNVALPSISADLGFTPASLAWVVNALHARVRGLPAARRARGRPARAARGVRGRAGAVRARVARRRARAERAGAGRRAGGAGARRRDRRAGDALDPHHRLPGGRRAQPGARAVGRDGRDRRRVGRAARRHPDRGAQLALDPHHQRADRPARRARGAARRAHRPARRRARRATSTSPARCR